MRPPSFLLLLLAICLLARPGPERLLQSVAREPIVVVLYNERGPAQFRTPCPAGKCRYLPLNDFACPDRPVEAVILSGHRDYPLFAGRDADFVADIIACLNPEVLSLDVCHSADALIFDRLARAGVKPIVVGVLGVLPPNGLVYERAFFEGLAPEVRAAAIHTRSGAPVERWRVEGQALEAAHRVLEGWDATTLRANLVSVLPNLVAVPIPGGDARMLVEVPPVRFRPSP